MRILRPFRIITAQFLISSDDVTIKATHTKFEFGMSRDVLGGGLLADIIGSDDRAAVCCLLHSRVVSSVVHESANNEDFNLGFIAAGHGAVRILGWLGAHGFRIGEEESIYAANQGFHRVIDWMEQNDLKIAEGLCREAAWGGMVDTLDWLRGHSYSWDVSATIAGAESGCLKVLQYIWEHDGPWPDDDDIIRISGQYGDDEIFRWQVSAGCRLPAGGLCGCIDNREFNLDAGEMLEWIYDNGFCDCDGSHHDERYYPFV